MRSVSNPTYQFSSVSGTAMALTFATTASMPPRRPAAASTQAASAARRDVDLDTAHTRSPPGQLLLGHLDLAGVTGAELDGGALVGERLDDRPADAAGAAGDEHARAAQLQIHVGPPGRVRQRRRAAAQLVVQAAVGGGAGSSDLRAFTTAL